MGTSCRNFPQLKAYGVSADGTRQQLDCDAIVIELDGERGLIVSLSERRAGEGVAICSLPRAEQPSLSSDPQEAELSPTNASQYPLQIPHLPIKMLSLNSFFRPTPWFTGAILASVVAPALPGSAATFLVNKSFWGNHSNEGTFSWAIH